MRLYPEDIAVFFDLIPIGTKVTVVNQPYLVRLARRHAVPASLCRHGRRFAQLDQGPQAPARQPAAARSCAARSPQHDDEIDWQRVGDLAHTPRAVPVPVTGGHDGVDAVIAQCVVVENTLPEGSNWDGQSGLLVDEKTFNELLNGRDKAPPYGIRSRRRLAPQTQAAVHALRFLAASLRRVALSVAAASRAPTRRSHRSGDSTITPLPMSISFEPRIWTSICGSIFELKTITGSVTLEFKRLDPRATQLVLDTKGLMIIGCAAKRPRMSWARRPRVKRSGSAGRFTWKNRIPFSAARWSSNCRRRSKANEIHQDRLRNHAEPPRRCNG